MNDEHDEYKILAVGSDGTKGHIKLIDKNEDVKQNYHGKETKACYETMITTISGI